MEKDAQTLLDRIGEALGLPADDFLRDPEPPNTLGEQADLLLALFTSIADPTHRSLVLDYVRLLAKPGRGPEFIAGS